MLPQRKIKVALTGGIGTGKTYISKQFLAMGIPVFYADEEAKKLYADEKVIAILKEKYPNLLFTNHQLDFSKLSDFIFSNAENRKQIETIIHPLVMQQFEDWVLQQVSNIVMLESAIIYEAGLEKYFDKIFVVDAPLEIRIERIKNRDLHVSEEKFTEIIEMQLPQEEKCRRADLVICNPSSITEKIVFSPPL
jgi:dephospho-CoA kinase